MKYLFKILVQIIYLLIILAQTVLMKYLSEMLIQIIY